MTPTIDRVRALISHYENGRIPTLPQHEVNPGLEKGSRGNYLYFTLPVCINFQRSSPSMWKAALATYEDPETRYLFFPELTVPAPHEKIREDLGKHRLGLQPNKHTEIWMAISSTLNRLYRDDPREILLEANHDAGQLIRLLQVERRADFPYLRGPKLSNYWPFILSHYTDMRLANMQEISIIPDTHVIQSTAALGLAPADASPLQVEELWKSLLKDSGISPVTVHPVLWNWSRNHFQPEV